MSAMLVDGIFPEVHGKDYVTVPFALHEGRKIY